MAKESVDMIIEGGKATLSAQMGQKFGPLGVNIQGILNDVNKKTEAFKGMKVPVKIHVETSDKNNEFDDMIKNEVVEMNPEKKKTVQNELKKIKDNYKKAMKESAEKAAAEAAAAPAAAEAAAPVAAKKEEKKDNKKDVKKK